MKPSSSGEDTKSTAGPHVDIYLVDTSVWIRSDRKKEKELRERLKRLVIEGTAYICWPVRVELLIGAKDEDKFRSLDETLSVLPHLPIADETWREAARMGQKLARRGQTVPLIDLLVASIAIESGMTIWTVDSDFKRVQAVTELRVDWFGLA